MWILRAQTGLYVDTIGTNKDESLYVEPEGTDEDESLYVAPEGTDEVESLYVAPEGTDEDESLYVESEGTYCSHHYECLYVGCKRTFFQAEHLKVHLKIHTGD